VSETVITLLIDGGATLVSLIRWDTHDARTPGVPNQQTLERLVCAAICASYPLRGECVQSWLDSRQMPQALTAKEYVWSHMAGCMPDTAATTSTAASGMMLPLLQS